MTAYIRMSENAVTIIPADSMELDAERGYLLVRSGEKLVGIIDRDAIIDAHLVEGKA